MSTQVQFRRGTTTQNNAFTGAIGEISVDTDLKTIRLHDGTTAGGGSVMLNNVSAQTALNKTFSTGSVWQGTAVGLGYGGTGSSLTATAGAVAYSTASGLGLSAAGTSGQILVSGGTGAPTWVASSSISSGTATLATTATNIAGGSAGQLIIQADTGLSTFITAGAAGTFLQSAGAGYAPTWAAGQVILGSTAVALGSTALSIAGLSTLTMTNGSYGGGSISGPGIVGTGPWTVTVTGITSTAGLQVGQQIIATAGTGSLYNGTPTSVVVASVVSSTSITVTVTGGTTPTAGTITGITVLGYLQVPTGTTAQRPWTPAVGMVRYNTSQTTFEGYSAGAWSSLGGVTSVDKFTYIQAETAPTVGNGDLEFFAANAGKTAAVQVGKWNYANLIEYTGTLVGTQTTQNVFNTTATTLNIGGAATAINLGNATAATLTVRPGTVVGSNTTQALFDTVATTLNIGGAATTVTLGNATAATLTVRPGTVVGSNTTQNVFNTVATTVNAFGAATTLSLGASTGTTTVNNNLVVTGNFTVNGTTETINATTIQVADKNIEIGITGTPTDTTANGGGITLKGATDKTIIYDNTNNNWTSSENWNIATGKTFKINNIPVLTSTAVLNDSTQTSITIGGSATTISLGATTGTLTVNNTTLAAKAITASTTLGVTGATTLSTLSATSGTFSSTLGVTGATTLSSTLAVSGGTTLSSALTYGGVTLSNSVTGTGSMVLSASPTFTGTINAAAITTSGNVTVGGSLTIQGGYSNIDNIAYDYNFTGTTSGVSATAMTSFATATFRSGKLLMQVVNGTAYRILDLLLVHDGTTVTISENYAVGTEIQTGATNTTFSATISAGTLTVYATASSGTSVVKGHATLFKV